MGIIPSPSCPQTAGKKSTMRWERMADEAPPPTLRPSQKTTKRKRRGPHLPGTVRNTIPVWILKLLKGFQLLTPPTYSDPPTRSFSDRQLSADRTRTGVPADAGSIRGQYTTFIQHKQTHLQTSTQQCRCTLSDCFHHCGWCSAALLVLVQVAHVRWSCCWPEHNAVDPHNRPTASVYCYSESGFGSGPDCYIRSTWSRFLLCWWSGTSTAGCLMFWRWISVSTNAYLLLRSLCSTWAHLDGRGRPIQWFDV